MGAPHAPRGGRSPRPRRAGGPGTADGSVRGYRSQACGSSGTTPTGHWWRAGAAGCGPSGSGKTFFLEALGHLAVEAGLKVAWFSLEELGVLVRRHRADDSVTRAVQAILRARLIVVDDIGLLRVSPDAAEGFFRLVDAAYDKRSVAVSSNVHPAGSDELMPRTLTTATVDRLLHHAHVHHVG
jgi:DNA replication protein DnaC